MTSPTAMTCLSDTHSPAGVEMLLVEIYQPGKPEQLLATWECPTCGHQIRQGAFQFSLEEWSDDYTQRTP